MICRTRRGRYCATCARGQKRASRGADGAEICTLHPRASSDRHRSDVGVAQAGLLHRRGPGILAFQPDAAVDEVIRGACLARARPRPATTAARLKKALEAVARAARHRDEESEPARCSGRRFRTMSEGVARWASPAGERMTKKALTGLIRSGRNRRRCRSGRYRARAVSQVNSLVNLLARRWNARTQARGAMLVSLGSFTLVVMAMVVKYLGSRIPTIEILFFRSFIGIFVVLPFFIGKPMESLRTKRFGLHFVRGVIGTCGNICFFWTLTHMLLADAMAAESRGRCPDPAGLRSSARSPAGAAPWSPPWDSRHRALCAAVTRASTRRLRRAAGALSLRWW